MIELILIACVITVISVLGSILVNESLTLGNIRRHLTDDHSYAHFSAIDSSNYILTPSLLWTSPQRFTLTAGESIWIPKGWWHWIRTTDPSVAVNLWMLDSFESPITPHITTEFQQPQILLNSIEHAVARDVRVWKSNADVFLHEKRLNQTDHDYAITLKGYLSGAKHVPANVNLLDIAKKYARIPTGAEINVWVSGGYHDTGLHYDDRNGLLQVLKGRKEVTIYPPTDSTYLRPLSVLPHWATQTAERIEYNLYRFTGSLPSTSLPSARILYESIHNKSVIRQISKMKRECNTPLVWGCKLENGALRWELYVYHFLLYNNDATNHRVKKLWNPSGHPCIIHSIDLYDRDDPVGTDIHYYYKDSEGSTFPICGRGTTGPTTPESEFRIDTAEQVQENFHRLATDIGFNPEDMERCKSLLYKYPCKHLSVWNKYKRQIYIQYLGICSTDFVRFLREHKYPPHLIEHVAREGYEDIVHEITIVYDIDTLQPIRSGFYGIV